MTSKGKTLNVLLVEDSEDDAIILRHHLAGAGYALAGRRVDALDAFEAALAEPFDLVISDFHLGSFTALDALARFRKVERDEPFIIVSGAMGEEVGVEAMRSGAHDYIFKGNLSRLAPAIDRELREAEVRRGRRRDREALREQTRILTSVLESMADALVVVDAEGGVRVFNPAAERLFGRPRDGVSALAWPEVYGVYLADEVTLLPEALMPILRAMRGEETRDLELFVKNDAVPEGCWVSCNGTPLRDESGRPAGGVLLWRDITARKRAEEALRRAEEQFLHAQKMEAIGRLAGGVAHDFNNVLSIIGNYAALSLRDLEGDDPLREPLEEISAASKRAGKLTRQLLTFSRRHAARLTAVDLNAVIREMETMLRRLLGEDVELLTRLDPALPAVRGDGGQVEQVLMNLAVNARDAMPDGGRLSVETAASEGRAVLRVSDTGRGMEPEVLAHVFEPFFTTKEVGRGTGLGLATVYGIVTGFGGEVSVQSEPGRGATFTITLATSPDAAVEAAAPRPEEVSPGGDETVLLVEDDDAVRALAQEILKRHGYRVLPARNAGEALLLAERHAGPIHLVLTDVVMPHMGGRELVGRLRPLRPSTRVVFMSGYTDGPVGHDGAPLVTKPFTVEGLARAVRDALDA
ncbi:MAG: response regulator [Polyangiales bacterium]